MDVLGGGASSLRLRPAPSPLLSLSLLCHPRGLLSPSAVGHPDAVLVLRADVRHPRGGPAAGGQARGLPRAIPRPLLRLRRRQPDADAQAGAAGAGVPRPPRSWPARTHRSSPCDVRSSGSPASPSPTWCWGPSRPWSAKPRTTTRARPAGERSLWGRPPVVPRPHRLLPYATAAGTLPSSSSTQSPSPGCTRR